MSYPTPRTPFSEPSLGGRDCSVGPPSRLLLTPFLRRSLVNSVGVTREMTYLSERNQSQYWKLVLVLHLGVGVASDPVCHLGSTVARK